MSRAQTKAKRVRAARQERRRSGIDVRLLAALPQLLEMHPVRSGDGNAGVVLDQRLAQAEQFVKERDRRIDTLVALSGSPGDTAVRGAILTDPEITAAVALEARARVLLADGRIEHATSQQLRATEHFLRVYSRMLNDTAENAEFLAALDGEIREAVKAAEAFEANTTPQFEPSGTRPTILGRLRKGFRGKQPIDTPLEAGLQSRAHSLQRQAQAARARAASLEQIRQEALGAYDTELRARFFAQFGPEEAREEAYTAAHAAYLHLEAQLHRDSPVLPSLQHMRGRLEACAALPAAEDAFDGTRRLQMALSSLRNGEFEEACSALGFSPDDDHSDWEEGFPSSAAHRDVIEALAELAESLEIGHEQARQHARVALAAWHARRHHRYLTGLCPGASAEDRAASAAYFTQHCRRPGLDEQKVLRDVILLTTEEAGYLGFTIAGLSGGAAGACGSAGFVAHFGREEFPALMLAVDSGSSAALHAWDHHLSHIALKLAWGSAPGISLEHQLIDEICAALAEGMGRTALELHETSAAPDPRWSAKKARDLSTRLARVLIARLDRYRLLSEHWLGEDGSEVGLQREILAIQREIIDDHGRRRWRPMETLLETIGRFVEAGGTGSNLIVRSLLIKTKSIVETERLLKCALAELH